MPVSALLTTALSFRSTTLHTPVDAECAHAEADLGRRGLAERRRAWPTTGPVAPVNTLCVAPPLTLSVPVNVSVVITGSGVVGKSSIVAEHALTVAASGNTISSRSA